MTQNLFLSYGASLPSGRWKKAFPAGKRGSYAALVTAARKADTVLWVSAESSDWEEMLKSFRRDVPPVAIVVVSLAPNGSEALRALECGARGYCHALSAPALFCEVSVAVSHGGLWVGPDLMGRFVSAVSKVLSADTETAMPDSLSARECEVAQAVAKGLSNKEVAERLGITERTVKAHLGTVFEKLGVRDRVQLTLRMSGQ